MVHRVSAESAVDDAVMRDCVRSGYRQVPRLSHVEVQSPASEPVLAIRELTGVDGGIGSHVTSVTVIGCDRFPGRSSLFLDMG